MLLWDKLLSIKSIFFLTHNYNHYLLKKIYTPHTLKLLLHTNITSYEAISTIGFQNSVYAFLKQLLHVV